MVLYFTGTGNSRHVAEEIAESTSDELVSINQRLREGDTSPLCSKRPFVFVGPVYAGRLPRVMIQNIEATDFSGCQDVYFVATCAETSYITEQYVRKLAEKKNFHLLGFHSIIMPQSWITGGVSQPREVNDQIAANAESDIHQTIEWITEGKAFPEERPGTSFMSRCLNPLMYMALMGTKKFKVSDVCIHCGSCAMRCPLGNIQMQNGKPVWGKNCTKCCACIGGCPVDAIEYGTVTAGKTKYYYGK